MIYSFSSKVIIEWSVSHREPIGFFHDQTRMHIEPEPLPAGLNSLSEFHAAQKLHKARVTAIPHEAIRAAKNQWDARLSR